MTENLESIIRETASGPKRAANDSESVDAHSLADLIAVDKYLASKEAARRPGVGLRFTKIIPPGAE